MIKKKIALAFQGGGSHGAFAWGVADRLLEDDRLEIIGASGTSAGGMNAACVIQGLITGGAQKAKDILYDYWKSVSDLGKRISPIQPNPCDIAMGNYNLRHTLPFIFFSNLQNHYSPYELNPFNINPFFDFLKEFFDFKTIRESLDQKIFLSATHVKSGRVKVFSNKDFCADVLLASACLPFLFQAVLVDGEYYWDGGFIANPAIYPLIDSTKAHDIILIQLTSLRCNEIPKTVPEIVDRLKQITYNGTLVREMRAIHFITQLIDKGIVKEGALKRINLHLIHTGDFVQNLTLSSALNTDWDFLLALREEGYKAADQWIKNDYNNPAIAGLLEEKMFEEFFI